MYGIYIYLHLPQKSTIHVGKYTIHGWYGIFEPGKKHRIPLGWYIPYDTYIYIYVSHILCLGPWVDSMGYETAGNFRPTTFPSMALWSCPSEASGIGWSREQHGSTGPQFFLVVRFFLYFWIFKTWCFGTFWHVVVVFQLMLFSRMYLLLFCYYELWWWSSSSYLRPKSFNLTSRLLLTYLPNQSHEIIAGNRETFPKGWRSLGRCRVGFLTRYK